MKGKIYLVPNLLGVTPPESVLPAKTINIASQLSYFVVENAKSSRAFLKTLPLAQPIIKVHLQELPRTPEITQENLQHFLSPALQGHDLGVLSDAGCPGIADPGAAIVAEAHKQGLQVIPLVGPSSILLALMASGLEGQRFSFHGYLPIQETARQQTLKTLAARSCQFRETQIFIETPYRNAVLFRSIIHTCDPQTLLCVASNLTTDEEYIRMLPIRDWKSQTPDLGKNPTIFLLSCR